jgi:hypothetical protein
MGVRAISFSDAEGNRFSCYLDFREWAVRRRE